MSEQCDGHNINIVLRLYGPLARFGGSKDAICADCNVVLPAGSALRDLLASLGLPTEERGISFINGSLSAMPGMQPDLDHPLRDGDRVALFHLKSMWPFQYRHDVTAISEFKNLMRDRSDKGRRSSFEEVINP